MVSLSELYHLGYHLDESELIGAVVTEMKLFNGMFSFLTVLMAAVEDLRTEKLLTLQKPFDGEFAIKVTNQLSPAIAIGCLKLFKGSCALFLYAFYKRFCLPFSFRLHLR